MFPSRTTSLRTRISLLTLVIVLASLWALTLYASATLRRDMESLIGQQQAATALIISDDIDEEVKRRLAALEALARQTPAQALHSHAAAQSFLALRPSTEDLFNTGVTLHDRHGITLGDTIPGAGRNGMDLSRQDVLAQTLVQGRAVIGPATPEDPAAQPALLFAVPVMDAGGIVTGAVMGHIHLGLPNFLDAVRHGHYGQGGTYMLADRIRRLVITSTDSARTLKPLAPAGTIAMVDRFVGGWEGSGVFVNSLGTEVLASVNQVPSAQWFVAVSLPTANAFAPVRNMQERLWWAAALISVLALLLTRWTLSRQMAPAIAAIRSLSDRITLVQQDVAVAPLEVHGTDEIGQLITAFNALLQAEIQRKAMLREVLNTSNVGIFATDQSARIILANDMLGRLFGRPANSLIGMSYLDLVAPDDRDAANSNVATLVDSPGLSMEVTRRLVRADGTEFWGHAALRQFLPSVDGLRGGVCVITDVSAQVEYRDYELFRRRTLELLARNTALPATLEAIVRGVEELRPQALCSILLLQADGTHLGQGVAPSLPAEYNAAVDGLEIGPFVGSCGAAAFHKERVIAPDLQTHGNWAAYRDLTARFGLRACWSQPLLGRDGEVLGTIALYHRTAQEPLPQDIELIEQAAHLASLAIGQHRDNQAVLEGEERFRHVMETSPSVAVRGYTADGTVVFWNHAAEQLYGYSAQEALGRDLFELLFPAQDHEVLRRSVAQSFASGRPIEAGELALLHRDGHAVTVFSSHALVQRTNRPTECFCLDVDLSARKASEAALRESEERHRAMIEWTPHPMAVHRSGRVVYVNPATVHMMAAPGPQALLGKDILEFIHPDYRELVKNRAQQVAATSGEVPLVAEKYLRLDGQTIEVEAVATHILFDGSPAVLVSMQDITRRNQAQQRLTLAGKVFDHAREGIMVTDAHGNIVEVNAAFTRITGYERDDVLGRNPRLLSSGRQGRDYYSTMWQTLRHSGNWTGEVWNRRKSGEIYAELQTISTVHDIHGEAVNYVSLFSDITAAKEHAQYIERIAHYDALTNLPNRVLLADRLHQAMAQAQRRHLQTAVAFLDLDGFKSINDRHGHDVGDQLLMALAHRMRKALREGDTLARIGGDEFVAVLVDLADTQACVPLLSRLLQAAGEPVTLDDSSLQVTASIGVAFYPQNEDVDADQLLRQADQAMYQAKLAGKNRYHVFDAEQDRNVRGHHESLDRIRAALHGREFVLHYQPKVNMRTGQVLGAEALIRWQHPQQGLLAPGTFLPVVEDHPLAVEIGEWVLEEAITQLAHWNDTGLAVQVSVNIGARQLQHPDFLAKLRALLARHTQLDPSRLELEVLETSALEDLAHVSNVIQTCGEMGVGFALDDFGTGYSSLSYLKRLPATLLKIDQSFVRDMLDDPDDLAILDGVIGLASAFRRDVIAEGVETENHGTLLLHLGCDLGQGYGIARPMAADQFAPWVAQWQPYPAWLLAHRVHREDFALLYVVVEHRAWCNAVAAFVRGEGAPLSKRELSDCRFSRWLNREGAQRYSHHPAFLLMDTLHERLHHLAAKLHDQAQRGEQEQASAALPEFFALKESMAQQIQRLLAPAALGLKAKEPTQPGNH